VPLIAIAKAVGAKVASYSFVVTVDEAVRRNATREGRAKIDNVGIYAVAKRLIVPCAAEGFDERFEVRAVDSVFVVSSVVDS
jgi:ribosomal protein L4